MKNMFLVLTLLVSMLIFSACMAMAENPAETAPAVATEVTTEAVSEFDVASFYKKRCIGCHKIGDTSPLKGKTAAQVTEILDGYAAGTYGGAQKAGMIAVAKKLSADEIAALSQYIGAF